MIYPYLLVDKPLYGKFATYKEASAAVRMMSRGEAEEYVTSFWPHAFIYEHGTDWTVLPLDWRDRERLRVEAPDIDIPAHLSLTLVFDTRKHPEHRPAYEARMWVLAAATVIEQQRTKEFANQKEKKQDMTTWELTSKGVVVHPRGIDEDGN